MPQAVWQPLWSHTIPLPIQTHWLLLPGSAPEDAVGVVSGASNCRISEVAEECVAKAYQKWEPELNLKLFTKLDLANYRSAMQIFLKSFCYSCKGLWRFFEQFCLGKHDKH